MDGHFNLFPLSHHQKRILNIENLYPDTAINHIGGLVQINGKLHLETLQKAIQLCISQTESLRIRLVKQEESVLQYIEKKAHVHVPSADFTQTDRPFERMLDWAEREFKIPFSLYDSALAQFYVFQTDEATCGYLIKCHHIVADGWSMKIIIDKIKNLYMQLTAGELLIEGADNYSILIEKEKKYLSSSRYHKDAAFWKDEFSHLPDSFLSKSSAHIAGKRKRFKMEQEHSSAVYEFIQQQGSSLNALFTASLFWYLSKITGENDFIIGTPVLNRSGKKEKSTAGMTVSTMPFRKKTEHEICFSDFLQEVNSDYMKYFLHQRYPYDELVKELQLSKQGYDQLFQIYINSYNTDLASDISGCHVEYDELYNGSQPYSLQIAVKEWDEGGAIELQFDYKVSDYSESDIQLLNDRLQRLILLVIENPEMKLRNLSLLTEQEKRDEIVKWNQTRADYPKDQTIDQLFQGKAAQHPFHTAIEDGSKQVSYQELDKRSNQIARYLIHKGISRDHFAAVSMKHSPDLIAVLLGILKAGGAYVPIDPEYPAERIQYILENSEAAFFITDPLFEIDCRLPSHVKKISFDCAMFHDLDTGQLDIKNDPSDIAYMIYTSGSTGQPKGVMIEHQSLVNYIISASQNYTSSQSDSFALYSSIAFDLTVTSIYTPLVTGNKIIIYRQEDISEFILHRIIKEKKTAVIKLTPAHLALLKDENLSDSSIKRMIVGGEQLPVSLARQVTELSDHCIEIFNEYGPTEATVGCMIHKYNPKQDKQASVPIGIPLQNTELYLLDEQLQPVLPGSQGELYISGDNVARGYWKRPNLQKERFLDNPFIKGRKMYKTGDLAKRSSSGLLEYAGRKDHQIKLKGYRIELGEIELALLSLEDIDEAVVIDFADSQGRKQLAAYVVSSTKTTALELRKKLSDKLPVFMVPAYFIHMDRIPLTQNGKTDREALPDPLLSQEQTFCSLDEKQKAAEAVLLETAKEILGQTDIRPEDHFYQLGGDSIKAIQFVSKMKEKGLFIRTQDILTYPVFRELVSVVTSKQAPSIPQQKAEGRVMDTPITKWFWSLNLKCEHFWHQSVMLTAKKEISLENVKAILSVLISHHDALRMTVEKESMTLVYHNEDIEPHIEYGDVSSLPEGEQTKQIAVIGQKMREKTDVYNDVLFKTGVIKAKEKTHLLFTAHHLIADGVSWQILIDDFLSLLHSMNKQEGKGLPLKTHSYQEFSASINEYADSREAEEEYSYWAEKVRKIEPLYGLHAEGSKVKDSKKLKRVLSRQLTQKLLSEANEAYQTQTNDLLLTALIRACRQCTGKDVISLELEGHGREPLKEHLDFSRTFGWFTAMYPAVFQTEADLPAQIRSVKENIRSIPNKGIGYGALTYLSKRMPDHIKPELRFNYLGEVDRFLADKPEYSMTYLNSGAESSPENDLTASLDVTVGIYDGQLTVDLSCSGLYQTEDMEQLLDEFSVQLTELAEHCCKQESVEYTPSDFETASLSMEELDSLFK
ncbi:amino acid adenylation domain-containing protein [Bacillus mojavensis]|uniref:amino acid adenylation domain-containing protein n=1 Tax=Bacillus mojavensis TaxID=72360 RepID=UPI002DBAFCB3|nr:amino acid adenylation domain-containing protein [Bacillus mojavensis]MEC1679571.1 amino acid adenylation domain-containing protein [Bacillus mojavensis]MEC1712430.1 amino acid adenylation domain-containing protein [Bacillus mojavensis]